MGPCEWTEIVDRHGCPHCGSTLRHYNGEQDLGNGTRAPMYTCLATRPSPILGSVHFSTVICSNSYIDEAAARPFPEAP